MKNRTDYEAAKDRLRLEAARHGGTFEESTFRPDDAAPYLYATLTREVENGPLAIWAPRYALLAFEIGGYLTMNVHRQREPGHAVLTIAVSRPLEATVPDGAGAVRRDEGDSPSYRDAMRDAGRSHLLR